MIDTALGHGCKDFDSFLAAMKAAGVEVKRGKHLAFKILSGKRFIRCDSLGNDYTNAAIMERISGKRTVAPKAKAAAQSKPNLLIDIQAKMQQINSPGFERWAKIFNLKEMATNMSFPAEIYVPCGGPAANLTLVLTGTASNVTNVAVTVEKL